MSQRRPFIAPVIAIALLAGYGDGVDAGETGGSEGGAGLFTGTLGDTQYEVAVTCRFFDSDSFMMRSDRTDTVDSNGDGIIISGEEFRGKFSLTIVDGGTTYSTGRLENFVKGDREAKGSGQLFEDGGSGTKPVEFVITCN